MGIVQHKPPSVGPFYTWQYFITVCLLQIFLEAQLLWALQIAKQPHVTALGWCCWYSEYLKINKASAGSELDFSLCFAAPIQELYPCSGKYNNPFSLVALSNVFWPYKFYQLLSLKTSTMQVMVAAVKQTDKRSVFYLQTRAPKIIIKKSRKAFVSFKGIYSLLGCNMS